MEGYEKMNRRRFITSLSAAVAHLLIGGGKAEDGWHYAVGVFSATDKRQVYLDRTFYRITLTVTDSSGKTETVKTLSGAMPKKARVGVWMDPGGGLRPYVTEVT